MVGCSNAGKVCKRASVKSLYCITDVFVVLQNKHLETF